jgi:hypothetical protein
MKKQASPRLKALSQFINNLTPMKPSGPNKAEQRHAEEQRRISKAVAHGYLNNMAYGRGRYRDWNMLAMRCNIGQYVANRYFEANAQLYGGAALEVLRDIHDQYNTADNATMTEDQIETLEDALVVIDAMQDLCSPAEWSQAVDHIFKVAGVIS